MDDGTATTIVTPHQLGSFRHNEADPIRAQTQRLQRRLTEARIPLRVLPGADVRIEPDLPERLRSGQVLSLADRRRHVLLELPHELYVPLESAAFPTAMRSAASESSPTRNAIWGSWPTPIWCRNWCGPVA